MRVMTQLPLLDMQECSYLFMFCHMYELPRIHLAKSPKYMFTAKLPRISLAKSLKNMFIAELQYI